MSRELDLTSDEQPLASSAADDEGLRHELALTELRRQLTRKIVALAKAGGTDLARDVMDVDVSFFLDPELFAREQLKLFRETPLVACLSTEIAEPGSYQVFDDAGVPIVVMRGKDGQVRAFLNVCPHRGARVIRDDCGKAGRFTCRFHGWTFDTTGKAVGIPEEAQFCGQIEDRKRLTPCPAEERHGLVFVQATPHSTMDLDAHLGAFGAELDKLGLSRAVRVLDDEVHVRSNWKYTIDTYFENYHLPSLHRDTFAHVFAHNLCMLETWGPHQRFTFPQRSIHDWMHKPEAEWDIDSLPAQHLIFPNTVLTLGSVSRSGSLVTMHRLFPKSVGELTTKITLYAPHGVSSPEHRVEIEASFSSIMRAVKDEDYSVTGEAYAGLAALPPGARFPVGRQEIGTQNFHRNVEQAIGSNARTRAAAHIEIRPLRDDLPFGARILGVTEAALADEEVRKQINEVFEDRGMIVFEDMEPSSLLQVALSKVFGPLKDHPIPGVPRAIEDLAPGVIEVTTRPGYGSIVEFGGRQYASWLPWHFDHCYNNELNRAGVLRCVKSAPDGGMTGFADGVDLYRLLSPDLRAEIESCNILYTMNMAFDVMRFGLPEGFREVVQHPGLKETLDYAKAAPRAVHPAVWTRASGEKVLHISPWMAVGIEGRETPEGDALLEAVCQELIAKIRPYHHQWRPTDMLIWDNWRMLHSVTGHDPGATRSIHRTTIRGDYGLGRFENGEQGRYEVLERTV